MIKTEKACSKCGKPLYLTNLDRLFCKKCYRHISTRDEDRDNIYY